MRKIVMVGSGGCMRELAWQIQEQNKKENGWKIIGYVDVKKPLDERGMRVGNQWIPYLGDDDYLLKSSEKTNVAVCVGEPLLRKKIAENLMRNPSLEFPNLILEDTRICSDVKMGKGCIISMDARVSTNVSLGDFVFLNIGSMVCHDGHLGDFVTLSPRVTLAGNVSVGNLCEIGMGTNVRQGICIGENTIVGAGSVVVKDVEGNCTVAGVPAKKIRG